jgi:hypothetical protein
MRINTVKYTPFDEVSEKSDIPNCAKRCPRRVFEASKRQWLRVLSVLIINRTRLLILIFAFKTHSVRIVRGNIHLHTMYCNIYHIYQYIKFNSQLTYDPGGMIALPFGYRKFFSISEADTLTSYIKNITIDLTLCM